MFTPFLISHRERWYIKIPAESPLNRGKDVVKIQTFKPASFQIFIVFHVEPHTKKQSLQSTDQSEDKGQGVHIRDVASYCPEIKQSDP